MTHRYLLFSLGTPRLENEAGHEVRLGTRKHLALLLYLATEPIPHRRDWLVELLWPASGERTGRQSLATALCVFRARLGREALQADSHYVQLDPSALGFDVDRLLAGDILATEHRQVMDLDGFLPEFDIDDAPEFGAWRERTRTRLLPKIKAGLLTLMDHARRSGDMANLARSGERLLAIDDLAEEGIRAQMEVSAFAGDRLTAIRVYDAWSQRLLGELGATPSRQLDAMATRLRRRNPDRSGPVTVREVRTEEWRNRPFCGRTNEYRAIYNVWEQAKAGHPRHVLLMGQSGVGKTTLIDRLATSLAMEGAVVARVRCFEMERGIPYAALASGLRRLIDQPGAAATSPKALAEIARFVPETRTRFPNLPAPIDAPGESAQIQFAEAVLELLAAVLEDQPVVWLVDDYHIADEASLTILHMVIRRIEDRPLLTLLTAHPHLPPGGAAARIRDGANRLGITEMELGVMPDHEIGQLLDTLAGDLPSGPSLVERKILLGTSGGYPLALEHLVADWSQRGEASLALSLGAMTRNVTGLESGALGRMTGSRTDALTPVAKLLLGMAAILDRRLGELGLYRLVGISVPHVLAAIAELVDHGALRETAGVLEFTSPMIRAAAYLEVPAILRQTVHAQVADILLERDAAGEVLPGLEVAWHCVRGDRPHRVAPFLLRGAKEAMMAGAPHEADLALRTGMPHLSSLDRSRGQLQLAELQQGFSQWEESLVTISQVDVSNIDARAGATVLRLCGTNHLGRLSSFAGMDALQELRAIGKDPAIAEDVRLSAFRTAGEIISSASSLQCCEDLIAAFDSCRWLADNPHLNARRLETGAFLVFLAGDYHSGLDWLLEAEAMLSESAPRSRALSSIRLGLSAMWCGLGSYDLAEQPCAAAYDAGVLLDHARTVVSAATNLSLVKLRTGDYSSAVRWGRLALERHGLTLSPGQRISAANNTALALAQLGRKAEAVATLEQVRASARNNDVWQEAIDLRLADVLLVVGRPKAARKMAGRALIKPTTRTSNRHQGARARWLALLAIDAGHPQGCHRELEKAWEGFDRLDALDRAELLLASRAAALPLLKHRAAVSQAAMMLQRLPEATRKQLVDLGFAPDRLESHETLPPQPGSERHVRLVTRLDANGNQVVQVGARGE